MKQSCGQVAEQPIQHQTYEHFERFSAQSLIELYAGEAIERSSTIAATAFAPSVGEVLHQLAANVEAAHRGGVLRPVEEAAAVRIAKPHNPPRIACSAISK